jgi:glycosyltransferase involved in cell wall biosynthesis
MKLLIITQIVDKNDPVLGFMHHWLEVFSKQFEKVTVICLTKGHVTLPENVHVLSLGKEEGQSRIKYISRFYRYIWQTRKNYDTVFVHMNQEYVLMGFYVWKALGKKITMWRNHHAGDAFTNMAMGMCDKIFCTSKYSYTAKSKKTVLMPVGIDTDVFKPETSAVKIADVLFLARISPVKKPDMLIDALIDLHTKETKLTASIYGDALPKDALYHESLKEKVKNANLEHAISFQKGVPNVETVKIYNEHEIFVNLSTSGMYDKTIFEAAACERLILASNENLRTEINDMFIFTEDQQEELAEKLKYLSNISSEEKGKYGKILREYVISKHSLTLLADKLKQELITL